MQRSQQTKPTSTEVSPEITLASTVAPEDLQLGDFVTLLNIICELPSYLWCADATTLPIDEPVRIRLIPAGAGKPLKVQAICLPFVLVKKPSGKQRTLDLRQCRLARLDRSFATATWKASKKGRSKRK
ncbi:MAG: hypothetical protein ABGX16_18735 [Pirellulales bacterium]